MPTKISHAAARRLDTTQRQLLSAYFKHPSQRLRKLHPNTACTRSYASKTLHTNSLRLTPPSRLNHASSFHARQPVRHLSEDTKKWVADSFKGAARLTVYFWSIVFLAYVAWEGWEHDKQERLTPTPAEWSFWTRYYMREAKMAQTPSQAKGLEVPRWIDVANAIKTTVERLEDRNIDGADIRSALGEGEGDILVEGVGRAGLDITACPEPWRRSYFDALMTAGTAAEHVDNFVVDKTRDGEVFPPQVVIGPSNPSPLPMPFYSNKEPPKEENCSPFFDPPQKYYMKILTTTGFTSNQRLQAALAYGDWLDFKGLPNSARDMFDWALDIADASYIERGVLSPYDRGSGTLRNDTSSVSSNSLRAITAMAEHLAKCGDTKTALPAFLTALRIQRQLQPAGPDRSSRSTSSSSPSPPDHPSSSPPDSSSSSSVLSYLTSFIEEVPYPPIPPSGDLPATSDASSPCAEAAVLAHIGEILYVSPPDSLPRALLARQPPSAGGNAVQATTAQAAGLAWTRQAVDLAEHSILKLAGRASEDSLLLSGIQQQQPVRLQQQQQQKKKKQPAGLDAAVGEADREAAQRLCAQCLDVAVGNWQRMVGRLAEQERALQAERARVQGPKSGDKPGSDSGSADAGSTTASSNGGWLAWLKGGSSFPSADGDDIGQWINEGRMVEERKFAIRKLLREEKLPINL